MQGISGSQRFQIHKAYGAPERLPSAHTWLVIKTAFCLKLYLSFLSRGLLLKLKTVMFSSFLFPLFFVSFNQLDLPEYTSKEQLQERLLLAIHEASEGFGFG